MDPAANETERRKQIRYPHGDLDVRVHKPGLPGVLRSTPQTRCVDFSLSGLQVTCSQRFATGDRVVIDLRLREVRIDELCGVVCSARTDTGGFRYGIRFCFEADRRMRSSDVSDRLRRVASHLKQNLVYS